MGSARTHLLDKSKFKNIDKWIPFVDPFRGRPGSLGNIDLQPESGTMPRKLLDYHQAMQKRTPLNWAEPKNPIKLQQEQRERAHRARLGIVGNNLADLPSWRQDPQHKSGFKSEKPQRQQAYTIQKAIRKHQLAYDTVHNCGIFGIENNNVAIHRNSEHGSCSCKGVKTCGSIWACPVCRQKILNKRSDQIKQLASHWTENSGHLYMLTFTVPHNKGDSLARIYGSSNRGTGLAGALSQWRSWYAFSKKFKNQVGYKGDIRTVEVTWGKNGWHCHIHMLVLAEYRLHDKKATEKKLLAKWQKACCQAGLKKPSRRGFDIQHIGSRGAAEFSGYIAKWGAPGEVSSQHTKAAKNGNLTVAELEKCLIDDFYRSWKKISLAKACKLLSIYYQTMKGQKMMQAGGITKDSNWREDLLAEIEKTDDQLAAEEFPGEDIAEIHPAAFAEIAKRGLTFRLLDKAESGGYAAIVNFMQQQGLPDSVFRPVQLKYYLDQQQHRLINQGTSRIKEKLKPG